MVIGIDLGTTFTAAAYIDDDHMPHIIENAQGNHLTPSVVMEDDDGSIIVGEAAKENMILMGNAVIAAVKNHMGTKHRFTMPSGEQYSPEQVSAFILKKVIKEAEQTLGTTVREAAVTVPAYFNDAQRQATKDAGKLAGIRVTVMPNEPTAAALFYAWSCRLQRGRLMVYDLGGGTFDASVVEINGDGAEVIATGGIRKMGGHFFDQMILNYVADHLLETYDLDIYDDEFVDELQELSVKAENCKIQLSSRNSAEIVIRIGGVKERFVITREQFEGMIANFYSRTESTVRMVLEDAKMSWKEIDRLVLVGGSSRIPYIVRHLREFSGMEPSHEVNQDEAVALGAALYAAHARHIQDVCSHSLGIISKRSGRAGKYNSRIIPRNTVLPARFSRDYYIGADEWDKIFLEITEGEEEDPEYVNILAEINIMLPKGIRRNTKVTVEMLLDQEQMLHVYVRIFTEPEIYREIKIDRKSNLSVNDLEEQMTLMERMVVR